MPSRKDLTRLKLMHGIRQVKRSDAEQRMGDARRSRDAATDASEQCRVRTGQASEQWREHLGAGSFDPLFSRGLADHVVARVSEEKLADTRVQAAERVVDRSEQSWRRLEAEARASERNLRQATRRYAHEREEQRSADLADRITYQWVQP